MDWSTSSLPMAALRAATSTLSFFDCSSVTVDGRRAGKCLHQAAPVMGRRMSRVECQQPAAVDAAHALQFKRRDRLEPGYEFRNDPFRRSRVLLRLFEQLRRMIDQYGQAARQRRCRPRFRKSASRDSRQGIRPSGTCSTTIGQAPGTADEPAPTAPEERSGSAR